MTMGRQDLYSVGFDMLSAALEAATEEEAVEAVRALASDFGADELRWIATMLTVETVWKMRPRRSRRDLRYFIDRRRVALMERSLRLERDPRS